MLYEVITVVLTSLDNVLDQFKDSRVCWTVEVGNMFVGTVNGNGVV